MPLDMVACEFPYTPPLLLLLLLPAVEPGARKSLFISRLSPVLFAYRGGFLAVLFLPPVYESYAVLLIIPPS